MIKLKTANILYYLLIVNILCIHHATCGLTSYIGSFFGFGRTESTTTSSVPPLIPTTPTSNLIPNNLQILPVGQLESDNTLDSVQYSGKYVPVVYYIPIEDLYQQSNSIDEEVKSSETKINSNYIPYYPYYHLLAPENIPNQIKEFNNNLEENLIKTPIAEVEQKLPKELRDLAEKLGYKDTGNLPSIAELKDLIGLSTEQETIDFILDLASTDYGLNLIKSYMIEEIPPSENSSNMTSNYNSLNVNNVKNEIENEANSDSDDMISNESNIMSVISTGRNFDNNNDDHLDIENENPLSTDKIVVRRQNDPNDSTDVPQENKVKSSFKRAKTNLEIVSKIISHPFQTGFFGTLRHWTGFFTKNPKLPNTEVPTEYGPINESINESENLDSIAAETSDDNIQHVVDPNHVPQIHYVRYPDGRTYMINPVLFDYYNKHIMPNQVKNTDQKVVENKIDESIVNHIIDTNKPSPDINRELKVDNNIKIDTQTSTEKFLDNVNLQENKNLEKQSIDKKTELLENGFRKYDDDFEDNIKEPDLEASASLNYVSKINSTTSSINTTMSKSTVLSESPIETTTTLELNEEHLDDVKTTTDFSQIFDLKFTFPKSDLLKSEIEELDEDQETDESSLHPTIIKPPLIEINNQKNENNLENLKSIDDNKETGHTKSLDVVSEQNSKEEENKINVNNRITSTSTVKTTILKLVSDNDEWKPQRISGPNSASTGQVFRSDPLRIVVPKMIVPSLGTQN